MKKHKAGRPKEPGEHSKWERFSLFAYIDKHPFLFVIISNAIAVLIVLLFFQFPINLINTKGDIKSSDWLMFVGSYLGFMGTLFLGVVAIRQNNRLHDFEQKRMMFEEIKCCSYLDLDKVEFGINYNITEKLLIEINLEQSKVNDGNNNYKWPITYGFILKNKTEIPINDIKISDFDITINSNFGSYTIKSEDWPKNERTIQHLFECYLREDESIPLIFKLTNIRIADGLSPRIESIKGNIYFECNSIFKWTSCMYLDFDLNSKTDEIRMHYQTECNMPTDKMFRVMKL